jgi:catechol 2,3-dioxygenase-like lactoylglutathione lyase family enzyme
VAPVERDDGSMSETFPALRATAIDTTDARELAEFYRQLLGFTYRTGDEPPAPGEPDPRGDDWLVLRDAAGEARLAFQHVDELPASTWPAAEVPQQMHLDLTVPDRAELDRQRDRAIALGARTLEDRSDDPAEALYVLADPSGHPFCIFVSPDHPAG